MPRDRLVPLTGALNFRDLGGYVGHGGRTVRWDRVFRSDALHALTAADLEVLQRLGLRVVYDFRRPVERERQPTVIPDDHGHRTVILAIGEENVEQPELVDQIFSGEIPEVDDAYMIDLYGRMLVERADIFATLLNGLAADDGLPAVFHCTAGKDRTGVAAALLLSILGVDEETIFDDYELSTKYRTERRKAELLPRFEAAGVDWEKMLPLFSARRPVLEATLRNLHAEHGTVESYLLGPAGMSRATLDTLRERLLE